MNFYNRQRQYKDNAGDRKRRTEKRRDGHKRKEFYRGSKKLIYHNL